MPNGYCLGKIIEVNGRFATFKTFDGSLATLCIDEILEKLNYRVSPTDLLKYSTIEMRLVGGTKGVLTVSAVILR